MIKSSNTVRITISMNRDLIPDVNFFKKKLGVSKSELFKMAFLKFSDEYKREQLRNSAEKLKDEYENNSELTEFTNLDSENFL